jgi:hypothetical protein
MGHTAPHAPQFDVSVIMSVQAPLHAVWPSSGQHWPALHGPGPAHATLHAPQFDVSVWRFTQAPPHVVSPDGQVQAPALQPVPPEHAVPQAPQLARSDDRSVHVPLQTVWPCGQQVPDMHVARPAQIVPHAPQLPGSVSRSVQRLSHRVWPAVAQQVVGRDAAGSLNSPRVGAGIGGLLSVVGAGQVPSQCFLNCQVPVGREGARFPVKTNSFVACTTFKVFPLVLPTNWRLIAVMLHPSQWTLGVPVSAAAVTLN